MRTRRVAGRFVCAAALAAAAFYLVARAPERRADRVEQPHPLLATYARLPLQFEVNAGQADARVEFLSRGPGYTLFLAGDEAVVSLRSSHAVRMQLLGARDASGTGEAALPGTVNYLLGNDPARWRTDVATYERVRYAGVYDGIDLVYYGNQQQLEYDFVVAPGADPDRIRFGFGQSTARLDDSGDLVLGEGHDEVRLRKPVVYQERADDRIAVEGHYALHDGVAGFEIGDYDRSRPLVIDPILVYSTYLGGSNFDIGMTIAVDGAGNAYVAGHTQSTDFPTANPLQTGLAPNDILHWDAFVTKINAAGTALVYSTYIGGNSQDIAAGIAVNASGQAVLTGNTASTDFPMMNPLQGYGGGTYLNGGDAFILKLGTAGNTLVHSTYVGGSGGEYARGLALDAAGAAYVAGSTNSTNFPVVSAVQTALGSTDTSIRDAFVFKINPTGTALEYSTYLGGFDEDVAQAIAVDAAGHAYVTGSTGSDNFPVLGPAQGLKSSGGHDAFVTKLHPSGSALVYSTYLGGSSPAGASGDYGKDIGKGVAVDAVGRATIVGNTGAGAQFPSTTPPLGPAGGNLDAFLTRLSANGAAFEVSVRLGGTDVDSASAVVLDTLNRATLTGFTYSSNFPVAHPIQASNAGGAGVGDWFVSRIDAGGALDFSTYLGGTNYESAMDLAIDSASNLYVAGYSNGSDFPLVAPIRVDMSDGVSSSAVVLKMSDAFVAVERPNSAAERLYTGTPFLIEWNTTLDDAIIDGFGVDVSTDDGVSFTPIPECDGLPTSARSCTWNSPGPLTAKGRIRVRAMFLNTTRHVDLSDARFSILSGAATVAVTQPNAAVAWPVGSAQTIRWAHNLGANSWVRVEATHDGGATWEVLAASVKNTSASAGSLPWTVTAPTSTQARVRVTWLNGPASDTSNTDFAIVAPTLTMSAPQAGTHWGFGTQQTVMWATNLPSTERVSVRLSVNGGATFQYLLANNIEASKKKVVVTVPNLGPATSQARVKVEWLGAVQAVSPVNFQISQAFVSVTSPDGPAQTWTVGTTPNIAWAQNLGILENVRIDLSLDGGASYPITLFQSLKSDGKEKVTVQPGWVTTQGRVRITWLDNPAFFDASGANFVIQ